MSPSQAQVTVPSSLPLLLTGLPALVLVPPRCVLSFREQSESPLKPKAGHVSTRLRTLHWLPSHSDYKSTSSPWPLWLP